MKNLKVILASSLLFMSTAMSAQSAFVENAAKSIFTLTTFKPDGSILASSHGIFISNNGEAVADWKSFIGAKTAVVVDAEGRSMNVESIYGANELYDLCKFKVNGTKTHAATLATTPSAAGSKVFLMGYSIKKPQSRLMTVRGVEKFGDNLNYYNFDGTTPDNTNNCPFVNAHGEVIGLMQISTTTTKVHATDVRIVSNLTTSGLSVSQPLMKQTGIRVALPNSQQDALLTLILSGEQCDSTTHATYIDEFMQRFPTATEGYSNKAQLEVRAANYAKADNIMNEALKKCTNKAEVHSDYSKLVFDKAVYRGDSIYPSWNLDKALSEAEQAYAINALPAYRHQQAQIYFSKTDYQKAYDMFVDLSKNGMHNSEVFYEAAQCKAQLKADAKEVLTLLDSAVAVCQKPLNQSAAPYVLARGYQLDNMGKYREALKDYFLYDTLMLGRVNDNFYYTRYKCETKIKQYQQALEDIARCIIVNPREVTYYAEMASLDLRVKRYDQAIEVAQRCTQLEPTYADAWLILGLAQREKGLKAESRASLEKAKELGDKRAEEFLKK